MLLVILHQLLLSSPLRPAKRSDAPAIVSFIEAAASAAKRDMDAPDAAGTFRARPLVDIAL
jgi:hypothetical protein